MKRGASGLILSVSAALALSGCQAANLSGGEGSSRIAVTTSILGSVVEQVVACVGDETWQVDVLMPRGTDPHDFSPSSEQVARAVSAEVVVANGLGLEENLHEVLEQIQVDGGVVWEVAEWANPLPFSHDEASGDETHEDGGEHAEDSHDHSDLDPHFWLDASRVALVVTEFGSRMAVDHGDAWEECALQVSEELTELDTEVQAVLSPIPQDRRILVTEHESFGYFADRYGFVLGGAVVPGGGTLAQASSQDLQALITTLRDKDIRAVFGSTTQGASPLLQTIADESGDEVQVVLLYVESLGEPGGDADTYQDLMMSNARALSEALTD